MISQGYLQYEMANSGRPMTARRLTDWRKKQLLPRLRSRGRGTGQGKHYFWSERDILERAQFVYDAFADGATTKAILLALVWAGFRVPAKPVRQIWIKRLTVLERDPKIAIKRGEFSDDHYWDLVAQWTPKMSVRSGFDRSDEDLLTVSALKIVYDVSGYRPTGDELPDIIAAGNNWLAAMSQTAKSKYGAEINKPFTIDEKQISRLTLLLRKSVSATDTKVLLKDATIAQFGQTSEYLQVIVALALALASQSIPPGKFGNLNPTIRAMFRAIIGPTLFTLILRLIIDGNAKRAEKTIFLCQKFTERLNSCGQKNPVAKRLRDEVELRKIARSFFAELVNIWRGYNLFKLYNIS